jgi:hypothetical protein
LACYPPQPERVFVRFTIGKDGRVQRSHARGEQGQFENCLADVLAGEVFTLPAGTGSLVVSYPWR